MFEKKSHVVAKKAVLELRDVNMKKTKIIPIVNYAWSKSFAKKERKKTAISKRGWNPLNRYLLLHPEIEATKPINANNNSPSKRDDQTLHPQ